MTPDKDQKRRDAFHIFYESVLKPDHELRLYAMEEGCMDELIELYIPFPAALLPITIVELVFAAVTSVDE